MHVSALTPVCFAVALAAFALPASARDAPEIVKSLEADITVRVVLVEAAHGRLYLENPRIRDHPEVCPICERMALTGDSLLWIPVGVKWERDGGLLIDPVIELVANGRIFRSVEAWAGRPTKAGLVSIRAPARIPTGWECDSDFRDWKGVSVYVAFPREIRSPGGWPIALHLDDVTDANVKVH